MMLGSVVVEGKAWDVCMSVPVSVVVEGKAWVVCMLAPVSAF